MTGVIIATTRRSVIEIVRYPLHAVFRLISPILWTIPLLLLVKSFAPNGASLGLKSYTGSNDFLSFFMVGLIVSHITTTTLFGVGLSLKNLINAGVLETVWSYPVSKIGIVFGEAIINFILLFYDFIIFYFVFTYGFEFHISLSLIRTVPLLFLLVAFEIGLSLILSGALITIKNEGSALDLLTFFLNNLSGCNNPLEVMPKFLIMVSFTIPITYFLDYSRFLIGNSSITINRHFEFLIIVVSIIGVWLLGLWSFHLLEKKVRRNGLLHMH